MGSSPPPVSPLALPGSRYPTGWFQIGWADEIAPGQVRLVEYFGEQILLFRGESGRLNATDAYCLHLGMNMGVGGEVCGECVQCPWHGWHWDGDGRNTHIPFSTQGSKPNLQLRTWPIQEWNGCIMVWHDAAGREPLWGTGSCPALDTGEFFPIDASMRSVNRIRAHPQLVVENAADLYHVVFVHKGEPADVQKFELDGVTLRTHFGVVYGAKKDGSWLTPDGAQKAIIESQTTGIGHTWLAWPAELLEAVQFTNVTPVDDTHSDYFFGMTTKREPGEEGPTGRARRMIDMQMKLVEQDFFTWENMKVLHVPNFVPEEATNYAALRRWAHQFYPTPGPVPAPWDCED